MAPEDKSIRPGTIVAAAVVLVAAGGFVWWLQAAEPAPEAYDDDAELLEEWEGPPPVAEPQPEVPSEPRTVTIEPEPPPESRGEEETIAQKRTSRRLFGTAKVEAVYDRYDVKGVRLSRVDRDSFWYLVGIREGDVVLEVNGDLVDSPESTVELLNEMARAPTLLMRVRGADDEERLLEYRVPR